MDAATVAAITGAVDFATIIVGFGAIFAAVGLAKVSLAGGRMLMGAIRG